MFFGVCPRDAVFGTIYRVALEGSKKLRKRFFERQWSSEQIWQKSERAN
jgi:hypothetical protein